MAANTKNKRLRKLFNSGKTFIAADVYSAITGRVVERAGFKAAYLGGHACGVFHYAMPDNGAFPQVEQIEQAARIAAAIDIPLITDADTLGESVTEAYYLVQRYERAGISGIHVEDESNPKHSTFKGKLIPIADMQARLEVCTKARKDPDFIIIARCDEFYHQGIGGAGTNNLEEAIKRGHAYLEAGADSLCFPTAPPEMTTKMVEAFPGKVTTLTQSVPGVSCVLHTGWGYTGAVQLHQERAKELFETGKIAFNPTFPEKNALIDQELYDGLVTDWAKKTKRPTRKLP
jgi:2-methylisocitrate lyase-like PEP mutase family enzyme